MNILWRRDEQGDVWARLLAGAPWELLTCQSAPNRPHELAYVARFRDWGYCMSCGVTLRPKRRAA